MRKKQDAEVTLCQMRTNLTKANEELKERQSKLTEERKSLHELDALIHGLKGTICTISLNYLCMQHSIIQLNCC
jgi:hypothetical protein